MPAALFYIGLLLHICKFCIIRQPNQFYSSNRAVSLFGNDDFRNITDFNTPELVNLFGTATSDVAEMALGEISDTILKLQKEEKRRSRTFAGENAGRYACQQ